MLSLPARVAALRDMQDTVFHEALQPSFVNLSVLRGEWF